MEKQMKFSRNGLMKRRLKSQLEDNFKMIGIPKSTIISCLGELDNPETNSMEKAKLKVYMRSEIERLEALVLMIKDITEDYGRLS